MTAFDVLRSIMDISDDIDYEASRLAMSDYCPKYRQHTIDCDPMFDDCTECWKYHLEKGVQ